MLALVFTNIVLHYVADEQIPVWCWCVTFVVRKKVDVDGWLVIRTLLDGCIFYLKISVLKYTTYQVPFNGCEEDLRC